MNLKLERLLHRAQQARRGAARHAGWALQGFGESPYPAPGSREIKFSFRQGWQIRPLLRKP